MRWPTPSRSGPACLRRRLAGLLLTLAAAAGTLGLLPVSLIDTLDNAVYDGRLRMSVAPPDRRVMIVDIDEASMHNRKPTSSHTYSHSYPTKEIHPRTQSSNK